MTKMIVVSVLVTVVIVTECLFAYLMIPSTADVEAWNERDRQIAAALKERRQMTDQRQTEENKSDKDKQEPAEVTPPHQVSTPGQDGPDLVLQAAIEVLRAPPKPTARK